MRVVIDTNVLISYFLSRDSVPGHAVRKAVSLGTLILTESTLGELIAVLYRDKFDRYTTPELRKEFLHDIGGIADIVPVTRSIVACRDPNDDKFLDAAIHGHAGFIITGDDDLLTLHPFMGVPILTAAEFLKHMDL